MPDWLRELPGPGLLLVSWLVLTAESGLLVGMVLPGTTLLLALGALASLGVVPVEGALLVAVAGGVCGGQLGYLRGRRSGRWARPGGPTGAGRLPGALAQLWNRARRAMRHHAVWALLSGQWVVGVRTLTARAAGWSRVPYRLFAAVNMPVSAVWGATYATLGYLVTDEVTGRVGPGVVYFGLAVAATVALAGLVHRRVRRWRKPPEGPPDQPRASDPRPADRQLVAAVDR